MARSELVQTVATYFCTVVMHTVNLDYQRITADINPPVPSGDEPRDRRVEGLKAYNNLRYRDSRIMYASKNRGDRI